MNFKVERGIKSRDQIFDTRFHPKSENGLVAAVTIAGDVHLVESGEFKSRIKRHHKGSSIRKVRFTNDGHLVTIAKTVKVYDLISKQTIHTLRRPDGKNASLYSVKPFSNNIISAGDDDGAVYVWDTRTPDDPIFASQDCDQYISDIDGKYENRRLMLCTSGEGTLTAYDLRAKKMIEPQSELFEAGFQCMKLVDATKKVAIGAEDGSVYVFNHNEWAHTSGKFAIDTDSHNRGKCSIDCMEYLEDSSTFLVGCSDGKLRALTLWPHQTISESFLCRRSPLESIHLNPNSGDSIQFVVSGENYINIVNLEEKEDESESCENDSSDEACSEASKTLSAGGGENGDGVVASVAAAAVVTATAETKHNSSENNEDENSKTKKKIKIDTDDYLNIFN